MKRKYVVIFILLLVSTHYLHYKFNQVRNPFYNTIFSVPDLPNKFDSINIGDARKSVENKIGLPLRKDGNRYDYSERGKEILFSNYCVLFQIRYVNDTVAWKYVFFDD